MNAALLVIGGVLAVYALIAPRLSTTIITGPIVFTAVGVAIGPRGLDLIDLSLDRAGIETLLTVTLAVVLFVDATHIDVVELRRGWTAPARLLGISFPLMLLLGFGLGLALFASASVFAIAAIAVVLAPTDAALGQAVVTNPSVPLGIRQTLSVESGLNDGLALPVLLTVLAVAQFAAAAHPVTTLVEELVKEVGGGLIAGLTVAAVSAVLIRAAANLRTPPTGVPVSVASLGALAAAAGIAGALDGSILIAAFVTGLALAPTLRSVGEEVYELPEQIVGVLTLLAFVVFGGAIVSAELDAFDWRIALYALCSLLVLRPLATAIGAIGTRAAAPTLAFVGWFGPRGLASILFVAITVRKAPGLNDLDLVYGVMTWTVLLSVIAHGVSAWPGSNAYARWVRTHPERADDGLNAGHPHAPPVPVGRAAFAVSPADREQTGPLAD